MKPSERSGFTLVEIMIVVAIIALLAAIAIPNVLRGRTSANESAAIGNMKALVSSTEMYRSVNNSYPPPGTWVASMYPAGGVPAFGPPAFNVAMTGQTIQGYNWTYTGLPAGCALPNCTNYEIRAVPQNLNTSGTRSFFVDSTGQVRHVMGGAVGAGTACATIDTTPSAAGTC